MVRKRSGDRELPPAEDRGAAELQSAREPGEVEHELRVLFDHVPCSLAVIDRDYNVVRSNAHFRQTFYRKGATRCFEFYKGRGRSCKSCPAREVFLDGAVHREVQNGRGSRGQTLQYLVTAAPFDYTGAQVRTVIEMAQDVTEVVELRRRLEQVEKEKLEAERLAVVGETVAGLAHGMKNILMGLEGGLFVFKDGLAKNNPEVLQRGWGMIEGNVARISSFAKEFLGFARGAKARARLVDPNAILEEVAALYRPMLDQAGIALQLEAGQVLEPMAVDPEGLHTCLTNLLSNAADACLAGERKHRRITLRCEEEDKIVRFFVKDNGVGMDAEVRRKAFTSFFSTKPVGKGTGLGLLTTRRIVAEHGGRVEVSSARGRGSTFVLVFPRARLPVPTSETTTEERKVGLHEQHDQ
ncbi:MAG: hypothetical protein A2284_06170 [Deltaproteobacteria bacterium RIFOXYA12_FULL_61_11]|nr:MAG: hypothetical protein A2284_06170 [Deltaproteobacteria bacterium RIFOXYA12_FULL_61_11]